MSFAPLKCRGLNVGLESFGRWGAGIFASFFWEMSRVFLGLWLKKLRLVFEFSPIALLSRLLLPRSIVVDSRGVFPFLYLMSISSSCQGG